MSTTTTKTKSTTCNGEIEEELKNALSFKKFDVVSDDSNHHYLHSHNNNNNNKKDGRDCIIADRYNDIIIPTQYKFLALL